MAISLWDTGSQSAGTTSCSPANPASVDANDLIIICVVNKYNGSTPSTPTGYTQLAQVNGGYSSTGIDSGDVTTTIFYKVAAGTEDGTVNSVTVTGANCCIGRVSVWRMSVGNTWDIAAGTGTDTTGSSTAWSVTTSGNLEMKAGDRIAAYSGMNTDNYTYSSQGLSATGITFGTINNRYAQGTTQGHDLFHMLHDASVDSGSGTTTVTATATASGSAVNNPLGSAVIIRLRELKIVNGNPFLGAGVGTLTATASKTSLHTRSATMAGVGTLVSNQRSWYARTDGVGTFAAVATVQGTRLASAVMAGVGTLMALPARPFTIAGAGNITADPTMIFVRSAAFVAGGAMSCTATVNGAAVANYIQPGFLINRARVRYC